MMNPGMDAASIRNIVSEVVASVTAIPVIISETDMTKTQRKITVYETNSLF